MASSALDSAEHTSYRDEDKFSSSNRSYRSIDRQRMPDMFSDAEDWGESQDTSSLSYGKQSPFSVYQQQEQLQQLFSDDGLLDNLQYDIASPPIQTCLDEIAKFSRISTELQDIIEAKKDKPFQFSLTSLELLRNCGSGIKRLSGDGVLNQNTENKKAELSTSEIMRIASARFIQSSSRSADDLALQSHPYDHYFSCPSDDEMRNVQLAEILLAASEKVGCQQFDAASKLLDQCDELCCSTGDPVERVVYYFSEALREKIDRKTGRVSMKGLGKKMKLDLDEDIMRVKPPTRLNHQLVPFSQIQLFSAIQAIMENVAEAKKVHVVDFAIWSGVQWTVLMQALVARRECFPELLKITAIGTCSQQLIEDIGKRLETFARLFDIPFSFKIIMLQDMLELKKDLFNVEEDETIVVYARFLFKTMISQPERLESVMEVIKELNPCVIMVTEVESNHNSPVFTHRFAEVLFYFSAYFDCIEECMERDDENRTVLESVYLGQGIRTILAAEGEERNMRDVKIDVWRAFFSRFGMVEVDLGMASLYQANLMAKKFPCGSSCTLYMNGKCLIIGWKGTPIHSLSAWRFAGKRTL